MKSQNRQNSRMIAMVVFLGWFVTPSAALAAESNETVRAHLFERDEDMLSENIEVVVRRAAELSPKLKLDYLVQWVLPLHARTAFRMKAGFVQTNPLPMSEPLPDGSTLSGVMSPVFLMITTARETNRLDELRQRIEAIDDPPEPHQLRAKLALLYMIHSTKGESETAASLLSRLAASVRTRGENFDGRWWPETLALTFGMQNAANTTEMLDMVTSIYDPQVGQSRWSGRVEWDLFIASCFAKLQPAEERDKATSAVPLGNDFAEWIPASAFTADSRGKGHTPSTWQARGAAVRKVGGHNGDLFYLPVPLSGNFELMCDVTSFDYRETSLSFGGRYAQHYWTRKDVEVGRIRDFQIMPLATRMTEPDPWLNSRITVRDGVCTHYLNGRQIHRRTLSDGFSPWVALRAFRLSRGSIGNLCIKGSPVIPKHVDLSTDPELDGWYSYFEEPVADQTLATSWRLEKPDEPENTSSEIRHDQQPSLDGTQSESLLVYHRPMAEDGVLDYEFFYEPLKAIVHPALDRLVLQLHPDGVQVHWVTDGKWQRDEIEPNNTSEDQLQPNASSPVKLVPNAWNHVQLSLKGDIVQLGLNGTISCQIALKPTNSRQFGLFHFADQSSVRVRNLRWTADWRMNFDSPSFPKSTQPEVAAIERATAALAESYSQKLSGLKSFGDHVIQKGGPVLVTDIGVVTSSISDGNWLQTNLPLWMNISGDFDIQASFRDFEHGDQGEAGLQLMATLDGSLQEIRLARNSGSDQHQKLKAQTSVLKSNGQREYLDRWSTFEVTDGTLRLVRLGTKLHYLIAEKDSVIFRWLGSDDVAEEDLRLGDFCLSTHADKQGTAKVTWTSLLVRADRISGDAIPDLQSECKKLDAKRESMKVILSRDFTRQPPDAATFYRWSDVRPWTASDGGLKLQSAGADTWQSAGISMQLPISGDFDIRVEFDQLNLAIPGAGHQSGLYLQVDPVSGNQTELNSMLGVGPSGVMEAEGYSHSKLPNGNDEYRGTERHVVPSATALRMVRHGKRYTMLVRSPDENEDRIVSMTENTDTPIRSIRVTLHTGGAGRESSLRLKSINVSGEQ